MALKAGTIVILKPADDENMAAKALLSSFLSAGVVKESNL